MFHSTRLAVSLALGLLAERVITAPTSTPRSDVPISWGSCDSFGVNNTGTNLECANFEVPMDYHDSSAGNARLAVIKLAATANKQGTVFFNAGGPGLAGTEVLPALVEIFDLHFQGTFDVISWDPRGTGHTFPGEVYCFNSTEEDAEFWNNTPVNYINETISGRFNEQDFNELYSKADLTEQKFKDFTANCQNGASGPYLKYLGTSSTVRDLVALGNAILGKGEPINYWGISYGTVIGFNFINMFPECVGQVVLDGIVDPTEWASYKLLPLSLNDIEKTYSNLTDGCATAGRLGCKLVELTGDNVSGDDVKALLNDVHDTALEMYRDGIPVPAPPGLMKSLIFELLRSPMTWSQSVNTYVYQTVAIVLQLAQAHNVTVPGGHTYNVPSGNITLTPSNTGPASSLTSYSVAAITGADDFADNQTTIKDIFDTLVQDTRDITPTFGSVWPNQYLAYGWPTRSVEQLPPYNPQKLRNPILIIGNSADPIAPLASAQRLADLLGDNAFLVEQQGPGHTSIAELSPCTIGIMLSYLTNATLPQGRGTRCAADVGTFFPDSDG